jgi:hypothetical protein
MAGPVAVARETSAVARVAPVMGGRRAVVRVMVVRVTADPVMADPVQGAQVVVVVPVAVVVPVTAGRARATSSRRSGARTSINHRPQRRRGPPKSTNAEADRVRHVIRTPTADGLRSG